MKVIIEKFGMRISAVLVLVLLILVLTFMPTLAADVKQAFIGLAMLCAGYMWGSSVGSQKKDDAMTKIANNASNP